MFSKKQINNNPARISLVSLGFSLLALLSQAQVLARDADWPSYGMDYSNRRYVNNQQINKSNVSKLQTAWSYQSGVKATFQATPIVVDRVMYVSLPFNHVVALDAVTGKQLWRYHHERKKGYALCCGPANRGVAVSGGLVYMGTVDARLIALEAKSGKVVWDIEVADESSSISENVGMLDEGNPLKKAGLAGQSGISITMSPVVYKGMILIGITGVGYGLHLDSTREGAPLGAVVGFAGNYGRTGFLAAFDAKSGKRIWQFDTIAPQGWEGEFRQTTAYGAPLNRDIETEKANLSKFPDAAKYGGGSAWSTPAIDTKNGLLYFGTGNPSPQMDGSTRPGDNLYSVSLVCLDVMTGKIRWHYQQVPHDQWGYDVGSPAVLFDYVHQGKKVPAVGQAGKIGWYFVHHRLTGELLLKSDEFIEHKNMFARPTPEGVTIFPGALGGSNWSPSALNEKKQTAYVAGIHWPVRYTKKILPATETQAEIVYTNLEPEMDVPRWGVLSAIDLRTGKMRWQRKTDQPLIGGVLATSGGLVFMGEGNGSFSAFDADTGATLWQSKLDAGVNAPPVSYAIDGVQYIAVAAGGSQIFGYKQGDTVQVYALPRRAKSRR